MRYREHAESKTLYMLCLVCKIENFLSGQIFLNDDDVVQFSKKKKKISKKKRQASDEDDFSKRRTYTRIDTLP